MRVGAIDVDTGLVRVEDPGYIEPEDSDVIDFAQNLEHDANEIDHPSGFPGKAIMFKDVREGTYPVYVRRSKKGRIKEAKIVFSDIGSAADEEQ